MFEIFQDYSNAVISNERNFIEKVHHELSTKDLRHFRRQLKLGIQSFEYEYQKLLIARDNNYVNLQTLSNTSSGIILISFNETSGVIIYATGQLSNIWLNKSQEEMKKILQQSISNNRLIIENINFELNHRQNSWYYYHWAACGIVAAAGMGAVITLAV